MHEVVVYSRKGCHLCKVVKETLAQVQGDAEFQWREVDIDADPQLLQKFNDEVPVVFIDRRKAFKYRMDRRQFIRKLAERRRELNCCSSKNKELGARNHQISVPQEMRQSWVIDGLRVILSERCPMESPKLALFAVLVGTITALCVEDHVENGHIGRTRDCARFVYVDVHLMSHDDIIQREHRHVLAIGSNS